MKKRSLVCALAILIMACFVAANIALADTVDDLSKCVSGYKVTDVKGKDVSSGSKVNTTDVYVFKVFFEEMSKGNQFDDPCYYKVPEGITLARDFSNVPILLDDKTTVVGYVSGSLADNKLTVDFVDFPKEGKDVPWPELALESEMNVEFEGYFAGTQDENPKVITFGNQRELKVDLKAGASLDVEKTAGSYDAETQTIPYTVKATANGKIKNAVLIDVHESGMSLVTDSVKVAGASVTATVDSAAQFTVPVGDLDSGESVTVTYTMKVDPSELIKKDYVEHTFENTATVKGKNGSKDISGSDDAEKRVTHWNMKKNGSETTLNGTPVFKWTINVGDKDLGVDIGGTLVDTPDSKQTLYTGTGTPAGGPIEVKYEMAGGTKGTVYANSLDSIAIPSGAVKADITYYTAYTGQNPVGQTKYTNEASLTVQGNPWSTKGNVSVDGVDPGISKTYTNVTSGTAGTITYQVELDVPAGTDQTGVFYLYDTLKTDTGSGSSKETGNRPTVSSITVNGTAYTDYTVLQGDQASKTPEGGTSSFDHDFYILFGGTALTSPDQSVWEEIADAKVIITYTIPRNETLKDSSDTIDAALKNGATLKNTAALYFSPEDSVEASKNYTENSNQTMEKSTVKVDPVDHTVEYKVVFTLDLVGKDKAELYFAFVDTFDERFEFVNDSFSITKDDGTKQTVYKCRTTTHDNEKWAVGNVLTVPAKELYPDGNGSGYRLSRHLGKSDVLTATYKLKIKDDEYSKIDWSSQKTATIDFVNSAMAGLVNDDDTITPIVAANHVTPYPTGLAAKEATLRNGSGDMLDYLIAINPDGLDLLDGTDELIVTDTFQSANLALQPETIKVENLTTGQPIMDCWQIRSGGQEIVFTIPDETAVGISYATKVTEYGDNVRVANEVTISGILDGTILYEESMKIAREDSGATSKHGQFTLFKYDGDSGEPLKGAKFALYTTKTNDVDLTKTFKYGNTTYYLATEAEVGEAGYVLVDHVVLTLKDADTYLLVETKAPTGYEKLTDPIEFTFNPATEVANIPVMHEGNLSVANKKTPGVTVSVEGKKELKGRVMTTTDRFSFTITEDGNPVSTGNNNGTGTITFTPIQYTQADVGKHTYVIAEDDTTVKGITKDATTKTWTVLVSDNGDGTLSAVTVAAETDSLTFTNTYAAEGGIILAGTKTMEERDLKDTDLFTFTVKEGDNLVATGTNDDGTGNACETITFTGISYVLNKDKDETGEHIYTIREDKTTVPGVLIDDKAKTVVVTVTDQGDGKLKTELKDTSDPIEFTNTYRPANAEVTLHVAKKVEGKKDSTAQFTFTLVTNSTGAPEADPAEVKVTAGSTGDFGKLSFESAGTYEYIITEKYGGLKGYTYDTDERYVTIVVDEDEDAGKLIAKVEGDFDFDSDTYTQTVTNRYEAIGTIQPEAEKELKGRVMTTTDRFSFTITEDGNPVSTGNNNGTGTITFTPIQYTQADVGKHTYVIAEDDTTLKGITKDATTKTWTVDVSDNGDGTLTAVTVAAETDSLTFTNRYGATTTIQPEAEKELKGRVMTTTDCFSFTITEDGNPVSTGNNNGSGTVTFTPIEYTLADVGKHTYVIAEDDTTVKGITKDATTKTWTVDVSDNGDGTLTAVTVAAETDSLTFTNRYGATGTIQPEAEKELKGRVMTTTDCFSFTITEDGNPVSTGNNNGSGTITFTPIEYTLADVGKHTYVIAEDDTSVKGITKDATTKTWTVDVSDNGDGTLTAVTVAAETDSLTFTNVYDTNGKLNLTGNKTLTGRALTSDDIFTFTVSENGVPVATGKSDETGKIVFTEIVYTIADLGKTYVYTVTEDRTDIPGITGDPAELTVTVKVTDEDLDGLLEATVVKTESDELAFENAYVAKGSVTLTGTKTLTGRKLTAEDVFTFTVSENGETVATGKTDETGKITFTAIAYEKTKTWSGTYEDHTYTVTEDDTTLKGITKDPAKLTVTVRVTDDGKGTLKTEILSTSDDIAFSNTYEAKGSVDLQAFKYMKAVGSLPAADEKFDFILEKEDGTVITVQNGENGLVDFGTVSYTLADIGTHVYRIREKQLVNGNYITDPTVYEVTITVSDNGDGTLKMARTVKRNDGDGTVTDLTEDDKLTFVNDCKTLIEVFKQWQGGEEDEISLTLYAGDKVVPETETVIDPETGKPVEKINYVLTRDGYRYTFSQLVHTNPDNSVITYGVKEKGISGYLRIYQNVGEYKGKSDYVYDGGTIINRAVTTFRVRKVWEGITDESKRPEITLTLYCNGSVYNRKPSGPNKDGWYTWNNLPCEYEGRDAVYYVVEEPVPAFRTVYTNVGMDSDVTDRAYDGGTITNFGVPKTGDANHPILWSVLAVLGLAGSAVLVLGRKKRTHH